MHIEEGMIAKRVSNDMALYYWGNNINEAFVRYRNTVDAFLQESKVEIYCMHYILQLLFQELLEKEWVEDYLYG